MTVDTGRRNALLGFSSVALGVAALAAGPAHAEAGSGVVPQGAHALPELMERLRQGSAQAGLQDGADDPRSPGPVGRRRVEGSDCLSRHAQTGLGQHRHRKPLDESHAQFAQCAGVLVRASRLPGRVGHARLRAPGAVRPGHVGQIQARRDGRRRLQDEHAHRPEGRAVGAFRLRGPQERVRAGRQHDPGAAEPWRRVHGLPQRDLGSDGKAVGKGREPRSGSRTRRWRPNSPTISSTASCLRPGSSRRSPSCSRPASTT